VHAHVWPCIFDILLTPKLSSITLTIFTIFLTTALYVCIVYVMSPVFYISICDDCRARGLNREDAMDRARWRKLIGMIDDYDESSG